MPKKLPAKSRKVESNGGRSLVIVESPAKAKTINKYLGKQYVVKASKGHVRDLPPHRYGIDPGRNFEPEYEILEGREKTLSELREYADDSEFVYLATDLDREGEAIAWHLAQALDLPAGKTRRVVFNEITKSAITEAFSKPHDIDMDKVEAQQARRILDRVVGYELSPLLWKKIAKGLSAGRVQSVTVRLIVEREREIRAFRPDEYWAVDGAFATQLDKTDALAEEWRAYLESKNDEGNAPTQKDRIAWLSGRKCIAASLVEWSSKTFKPAGTLDSSQPVEMAFTSAVDEVRAVCEALGLEIEQIIVEPWPEYAHLGLKQVRIVGRTIPSSAPTCRVSNIETKRVTTKPHAPFTTATLQQSAANQLHFPTSRTMKVVQGLYEGVEIGTGEGNVGLITYMRTDSTNLSGESLNAIRGHVGEKYGDKYLPDKPNFYGKAKQAQEAHEAIRPTDVNRTPDSLKGHLTSEQWKLYNLIWNRAVASQMKPAEWDSTAVEISAETRHGKAIFRANGRVLVFDGFYRVMGLPKAGEDQILPPLTVGQQLGAVGIMPSQKFTSPPPRFTEASLVKTLEAEGIGRPSTYAAIIQTIQGRGYVEQKDRKFYSTARGDIVTDKLVEHFPKVMDVGFTSYMETELDKIEEAHLDWHAVLHEFYDPFKEALGRAHEEMSVVRAEPSDYVCEKCGKPMVYRLGKNGRFLSCTGYPDCKGTMNIDSEGRPVKPVISDVKCEKCGGDMILRRSRMGPFLGCGNYPDCDHTMPADEQGNPLKKVKPEDVSTKCLDCGGKMEARFARGRAFLGCTNYPKCKGTQPVPEGIYIEKPKPESAGVRCDKCGRDMVIRKSRRGPFLSCSGFPKCRNAKPMDKLEELKAMEAKGEIPDAPPPDEKKNRNGSAAARRGGTAKGGPVKRVDIATLGPPPKGFAWTRTGRPVVETWPTSPLSCPSCGAEMTLRTGRFGPFFSCGKCRNAVNLRGEAKKKAESESPAPAKPKPIPTDIACPDCGTPMLLRMGRTGRFLGCSAYPKCKKTMEAPPGLLRELADTTSADN